MASVVRSLAISKGFAAPPQTSSQGDNFDMAAARAAAGGMVRSARLPPTVPEFKSQVLQPTETQLAPGSRTSKQLVTQNVCIPP